MKCMTDFIYHDVEPGGVDTLWIKIRRLTDVVGTLVYDRTKVSERVNPVADVLYSNLGVLCALYRKKNRA